MVTFSKAEVSDLLKSYALDGSRYWNTLDSSFRTRILTRLAGYARTAEHEINQVFNALATGGTPIKVLVPTPEPQDGECKAAFFHASWMGEHLRLALILWLDHGDGETIAFRFEPADGGGRPHAYPHVQISRRLKDPEPDIETTLGAKVSWLPKSYPAFPTACREPVHPFLSMLAAVHGYDAQSPDKFALAVVAKALRTSSNTQMQIAPVGDALRTFLT